MNLRSIFLLLFSALFISTVAYASSALEHNFTTANELYQKGDYSSAIENYRKLVAAGVDNPVLEYNLGNAYFKTGQLGEAIACYYRALRLDPRNDDIKANFEFARQFMVDKVDPTARNPIWNWYKSLVLNYTANEWTVLTSIFFFGALAVLLYMTWTRNRRLLVKIFLSGMIVFFVGSGVCSGVNIHLNYYSPRGVIGVPEVSVKGGPGEDFDERFVAHEGLPFKILKQESGWYLGIFDNRLKGWIKISDAIKI